MISLINWQIIWTEFKLSNFAKEKKKQMREQTLHALSNSHKAEVHSESTVARLGGCWIEAKEDQFCQTTNLLHDPTRGLRTTPRYASGPLCGWCCYLYSGHQQRLWLAKEGIEIKGGNKQSQQTSQQMLVTWIYFF